MLYFLDMKPATIIGAVALVLIAGGAFFAYQDGWFGPATPPPSPSPAQTDTATQTQEPSAAAQAQVQVSVHTTPTSATVTYGPSGFSPSTVTVAKGGTVTFVNQSGKQMWVASDQHPTHQGYSGTTRTQHCPNNTSDAFDECTAVGAGQSYSFTFQKNGTWMYHNHVSASDTGTVVVK